MSNEAPDSAQSRETRVRNYAQTTMDQLEKALDTLEEASNQFGVSVRDPLPGTAEAEILSASLEMGGAWRRLDALLKRPLLIDVDRARGEAKQVEP